MPDASGLRGVRELARLGDGLQFAPAGAFGTERARFASAERVACLAGVAPVVERSGQSKWVHWRFCCPKFLRQSFVEYAGESVRHSFWARAFYMQQRARGKSHQVAVRALAYKWIRVMYRC